MTTRAVGTGPYRVASFKPMHELVLEAFNGYWGKPPHWRRAVFRFEAAATARVDLLLSGAADVVRHRLVGDIVDAYQRAGGRP